MKNKRKLMRKKIRKACYQAKPWIDIVYELESEGIPLNLILQEANELGKENERSKTI